MMTTTMKKAILLLLAACLLLTTAACGKPTTAETTTVPEAGEETAAAPEEDSSAVEETSEAAEDDLSAYPVSLLGQSVKAYKEQYVTIEGDTFFEGACQYEIDSLFPKVFYLTSSVQTDAYNAQTFRDDAVFETLYTAADTELYPELKTGLTYGEYAGKFYASPCTYKEEYASYSSTFKLDVNGKPATVYLFFWDANSVCRSILITINDSLKFSTLNVKEEDRNNYPALFIGQNAVEMQQVFAGALADLSGYDTELKKHMYLGIISDEPPKPIPQQAQVIGVHLFSDEWEAVPGIRIGDSAPGAGFTKYQQEEGDSFYYGTFLIGGFFAETYVMVRDDNFSGFEFLCKQLYD